MIELARDTMRWYLFPFPISSSSSIYPPNFAAVAAFVGSRSEKRGGTRPFFPSVQNKNQTTFHFPPFGLTESGLSMTVEAKPIHPSQIDGGGYKMLEMSP